MTRALAVIVLVLMAVTAFACGGGGGGSSSGPVTPAPVTLRTDLLFGYYGLQSQYVLETEPHANLVSHGSFAGALDQIAALTFAKANGMSAVVEMPFCRTPVAQGESETRTWLQRLHDAGLLGIVVAIRWCDEPNTARAGAWSDEDATAMNAAVRRAMASFPELHAALSLIYQCGSSYPGIASLDWIGCDHYDSGCGVLTSFYAELPVRAGQRLTLHPGGSSPWNQNPACFLSFAERDQRVVTIEAFAWQTFVDGATYRGIRDDPRQRRLYCEAGKTVKSPKETPTCP